MDPEILGRLLKTDPDAIFDVDVLINGSDVEPTVTWELPSRR
jgi:homoaconitase/3-isopropylmalate dehydratase large subunit